MLVNNNKYFVNFKKKKISCLMNNHYKDYHTNVIIYIIALTLCIAEIKQFVDTPKRPAEVAAAEPQSEPPVKRGLFSKLIRCTTPAVESVNSMEGELALFSKLGTAFDGKIFLSLI